MREHLDFYWPKLKKEVKNCSFSVILLQRSNNYGLENFESLAWNLKLNDEPLDIPLKSKNLYQCAIK